MEHVAVKALPLNLTTIMCGRFVQHRSADELAEIFEAYVVGEDSPPSYNVAPSQNIWAVRQRAASECELIKLRWGLIPQWSKEPKTPYSTINARAETVASKPAFRQAFRQRRCIIPASGYYEWKKTEGGKQPYYIHRQDDAAMAFAGLWEHWEKDGQVIESCSIIVTAANRTLNEIHDRMPVILHARDYSRWLSASANDLQVPESLLSSFPDKLLTFYPVNTAVNSPRNNRPELIVPLDR